MTAPYDTDDDGDWYDADEFDDGPACTWCDGDGIGAGCPNILECCGQDFCHPCCGSGLRSNQTVF